MRKFIKKLKKNDYEEDLRQENINLIIKNWEFSLTPAEKR